MKRLPRIAPVYLQNITPSLVLCPSLWDKTRDKTPFVPSHKTTELLAISDASREPGDGFELSVPGDAIKQRRGRALRQAIARH
jgi:hypothetical protein